MVARASAYRWVILLVTTAVQAGVSLLQQAPSALGPVLTRDLGISRAQVGLLSSAIWGGMVLSMLPTGVLIDRQGERRVVLVGVTAMAACVLAAAGTGVYGWIFALFLLASLGAPGSQLGGSKAIAAWFPPGRRGAAMGVRQTGVPLGGLIAALLLPLVAVRSGWASGLTLAGTVTLGSVLAFALFYREPPRDVIPSPRPSPRHLLQDRNFLSATGYAFVFVCAQGCSTSYLALYLHEEAGMSAVRAGTYLALLQVGGVAGRIGWGAVSDRVGRRTPVMRLVGLVCVGSSAAMAFVGRGTPGAGVALLAVLLGASAMGWNGLHLTYITESVGLGGAATGIGASLTIAFVGAFLAPPLFGLAADLTGSYRFSWLALAAWAAVGTAMALLVREPRRGAGENK